MAVCVWFEAKISKIYAKFFYLEFCKVYKRNQIDAEKKKKKLGSVDSKVGSPFPLSRPTFPLKLG